MSNDLSILIKAKIDQAGSLTNLNKDILALSPQIKEAIVVKLKIDPNDIRFVENQVQQTKQKLAMKTITKDSMFINTEVEKQQFDQITAKMREVKKGVTDLAVTKLNMNVDAKGVEHLKSAVISYKDETGKAITETMKWVTTLKTIDGIQTKIKTFRSTGMQYTDNSSKQITAEYDRLNASLKEQFRLKTILITAGAETTKEIQKQLQVQEQLTASIKKQILSKNLTNVAQGTKSLELQIALQDKLNIAIKAQADAQAKVNANQKSAPNMERYKFNLGTPLQNVAYTDLSTASMLKYAQAAYGANATIKNMGATHQDSMGKVRQAEVQVQTGARTFELYKIKASSATQSVHQFGEAVQKMSYKDMGFGSLLANAFKVFPIWIIASTAVMGAIHQVTEGVESVIDLNSALTNINMTMNTTGEEMRELAQSSQNMAKELGISIKEILNAAKVYANLNTSIAEIIEKTKADVMLATASGMNTIDTTDAIQAMMNQFEIDAVGTAERIANTLEVVSANMSMDFQRGIKQIVDGIKVSGSIAREAGFDLERYEAVLGAVVERTRLAGSQIGNSMKMIFSRMGRVNTGEASDEDISKTETAYRSLGIELRDQADQFKEIPKVLDELYEKWGNLSNVQRSFIAEQSAGVRQKNIFLNMMDSWGKSTDYYTKALNSNNFALQVQEKYMQSTKAKMEQFKATIDTLWQNFISSGFLNIVISGFTKLVNIFGNLTGVVGILTVTLMVFKTEMYLAFSPALYNSISKFISLIISLPSIIKSASIAIYGFSTALIRGETTTASFSKVLNGLKYAFVALAPAIGIIALTYFISKIVSAGNASLETASKIRVLNQDIRKLNQESIEQSSLVDEYEKLSGSISLTSDETERLKNVKQQLSDLFPEAIEGYDTEGKAIKFNNDQIKESIRLKGLEIEAKKSELASKFVSGATGDRGYFDWQKSTFTEAELGQTFGYKSGERFKEHVEKFYSNMSEDIYKGLSKSQQDLIGKYFTSNNFSLDGIIDNFKIQYDKTQNKIESLLEKKSDPKRKFNSSDQKQLDEAYKQLTEFSAIINGLQLGMGTKKKEIIEQAKSFVDASGKFKDSLEITNSIINTLGESTSLEGKEFTDTISTLVNNKDFQNWAKNYTDKMKLFNDQMKQISESSLSGEEKNKQFSLLQKEITDFIASMNKELPVILIKVNPKLDIAKVNPSNKYDSVLPAFAKNNNGFLEESIINNIDSNDIAGKIVKGVEDGVNKAQNEIENEKFKLDLSNINSDGIDILARIKLNEDNPKQYIDDIQATFKKLGIKIIIPAGISAKDVSSSIAEVVNKQSYSGFADIYKTAKDEIQKAGDLKKELLDLKVAGVQTVEQLGSSHSEALNKVIEVYPELLDQLGNERDTNGELLTIYDLLDKKIEDNKNKTINSLMDRQLAQKNMNNGILADSSTFFAKINSLYGTDIKNWADLAKNKLLIDNNLMSTLGANWSAYYKAFTGSTNPYLSGGDRHKNIDKANDLLKGLTPEQQEQAKVMASTQQLVDKSLAEYAKIGDKLSKFTPSYSDSDSGSKSSSSSKANLYTQALAKLNAELEHLQYLKSKLVPTSQSYRDVLAREVQIQKQLQVLASQEADRLRSKISSGSLNQKEIDDAKLSVIDLGDAWREAQEKINDLSFGIVDSKVKEFDENISLLKTDLDLLISQLGVQVEGTDEYGLALQSVTAKTIEYMNALRAKEEYIRSELTNTDLTIAKQHELAQTLREVINAQKQAKIDLQSQLGTIADGIINAYKSVYEKQKQAALDSIQDQMDSEEQRHDEVMDNLDDELSMYEDLIDAKLKLLEEMDKERDYNKDLTQLQKERQEIQDKINALSLDDSDWSISQREDLSKQLTDKDMAIEDLQYDHNLDLRKDSLEDLLDQYQEEIDAKKDTEEEKYKTEKYYLDKSRKEQERYFDELINDEQHWADMKSDIVNGTLNNLQGSFQTFTNFIMNNLNAIGGSIGLNLISKMQSALTLVGSYEGLGNSIGSSGGYTSTNPNYTDPNYIGNDNNPKVIGWNPATQTYTVDGRDTGETDIPGTHRNFDGRTIIDDSSAYNEWLKKYHDGGIVGNVNSRITNLVNKILNTSLSPNESLAIVQEGEIWTPKKNIPKFFNNISQIIGSGVQPVVATGGDTNYEINLNIASLTGDKKGANYLLKELNKSMRKIGK